MVLDAQSTQASTLPEPEPSGTVSASPLPASSTFSQPMPTQWTESTISDSEPSGMALASQAPSSHPPAGSQPPPASLPPRPRRSLDYSSQVCILELCKRRE